MNLLDLPEELLIHIVRRLDSKALFNVHSTCSYLRNVVAMQGVVKECKFSLSSLATPDSLNSSFFKDIAGSLKKLDVSCVPNLDAPLLLNAMIKLKTLKILNVSYTSINILDFLEIYHICPTINDICINFDFGTTWINMPPEIQEECQALFKRFTNVHFVGNFESLYYSNLPLALLQTAKLNKLQFTITDCNLPPYEDSETFETVVNFNEITVYMLNWKNKYKSHSSLEGFFLASALDVDNCEFIIIVWVNIIYVSVHASPLFKEFFKDKFKKINVQCLTNLAPILFDGNLVLMVWNKESTVFDDTFFNSLYTRLQAYFPHHCESLCDTSVLPQGCDWVYISQFYDPNAKSVSSNHNRLYPVLDLDALTAEKESFKLSIHSKHLLPVNSIRVPMDAKYLKKITYIDLSSLICYRGDLFPILFTYCTKLETLNLIFDDHSIRAFHAFSETLPLSKSIKNVRVVSTKLDFPSMLVSLGKCRNLENIQLVDKQDYPQPLSFSRHIFENCANLYNYSVAMEVSGDVIDRKLKLLNKLKLEFGRHHLNIELYSADNYTQYSYDPYIGVFNVCPIKPF